jgi:hypothetical protein
MLTEMAGLSAEDGMTMQIHAGRAATPTANCSRPVARTWAPIFRPAPIGSAVSRALLSKYGHAPGLRVLLFTLDETTYARELAPMVGHWPCLMIGPPWWFHDSPAGIRRYLDQVVETAGFANMAGFNDDTRAAFDPRAPRCLAPRSLRLPGAARRGASHLPQGCRDRRRRTLLWQRKEGLQAVTERLTSLTGLASTAKLPAYDRKALKPVSCISAPAPSSAPISRPSPMRRWPHAGGDWGIEVASLRTADVADHLNEQNGLYTMLVRDTSGT